jgi:hypothetical protein
METDVTPALPIREAGARTCIRGGVMSTSQTTTFGDSGDKDGRIDSTKRITDGHKQCAGDGARTMHKTGVELRESGDGRREPGSETMWGSEQGIDDGV